MTAGSSIETVLLVEGMATFFESSVGSPLSADQKGFLLDKLAALGAECMMVPLIISLSLSLSLSLSCYDFVHN